MKFEHLQGSIVAMVTPFRQDGSVNFDVLTELLERQIAAGTDGILTLGTTGEYSTMSHEEDAAVVEHTIRVVDGRVPVMVGSGSNCTATQIEKSIEYQNMGADALLLTGVSPANELIKLIEQRGYDLVVIGSRGLSGVQEYLGSVSHKVLHGSTAPVLVAK